MAERAARGVDVFMLPAAQGQRLCVHHAPAQPAPHGAVLHLHPFAEEMNKSRRMAAITSRALADAGHAVLQIDLFGCGDSSGDFGDATWPAWHDDALLGAQWLHERYPGAPLTLWGHRAGALLATQAAARLHPPCDLLLWQPALSGKQLLQQFLRLKMAASLQGGDAKGVLQQLRAELAAGRHVDIAGYRLAPGLASGLEHAVLELPPQPHSVAWLETSTRDPAALLPASAPRIDAWHAAGHRVAANAVPGPAFWQTQEIEDAPALVQATVEAMAQLRAPQRAMALA